MHRTLTSAALAAALAVASATLPGPAAAQPGTAPAAPPRTAFEARTVADLATLCGASPQAPEYVSAIAFCHGFLQGAGQYPEPRGLTMIWRRNHAPALPPAAGRSRQTKAMISATAW